MKINTKETRRWFSVLALCLVITIMFTGCASLKKKFIRQKKKDASIDDKFIPVLEPEEYPVKKEGPYEHYAQQYTLFNVWISDFTDNFQGNIRNQKRMIADLQSALKAVREMKTVVQTPVIEGLAKIEKQVEYLLEEYQKPEAFRNTSRISSELRSVDRNVRKEFKPTSVKASLIIE